MKYEQGINYTLSTVAKDRGILKSKLLYYVSLGMLRPNGKKGKTMLFDGAEIEKKLNVIDEYQKKGLSLKEIKNRILPTI